MERRPERFSGIVRPLRAADLPAVERILQTWVRDSLSGAPVAAEIAEFLARMSGSLIEERVYRYLVAVEVAKVEGTIGVVGMRPANPEMLPFAATERPVELINIYIDSRHRKGRGVGTALVRELERRAREQGYGEVIVNSGPRYRDSGWEFFDKLGYERRGMARDLYGQGKHARVWSKIL
jgi:ribosomal protein S18 acetylase RimI-like enzyme